MKNFIQIWGWFLLSVSAFSIAFAQNDTVVLSTQFDEMHARLLVQDREGNPYPTTIVTKSDDSILQIETMRDFFVFIDDYRLVENYKVEMRVRISSRGNFYIYGRTTSGVCGSYMLSARASGHLFFLHPINEQCSEQTPLETEYEPEFEENTWVDLQLEFRGNIITFWLNNRQLFSVTDPDNLYPNGSMYFYFMNDPSAVSEAVLELSSLEITVLESQPQEEGNSDLPITLTQDGDQVQDAIDELISLGVVPDTGGPIFRSPSFSLSGEGLQGLALQIPPRQHNFIMSGDFIFQFEPSADLQHCLILTRGTSFDGDTTYLAFGLLSDGRVVVEDRGVNWRNVDSYTRDIQYISGEQRRLTLIALDDLMSLYIDGTLIFEEAKIDDRVGSFSFAMNGAHAETTCEVLDAWVWTFD
jgi:hypothetical protein